MSESVLEIVPEWKGKEQKNKNNKEIGILE